MLTIYWFQEEIDSIIIIIIMFVCAFLKLHETNKNEMNEQFLRTYNLDISLHFVNAFKSEMIFSSSLFFSHTKKCMVDDDMTHARYSDSKKAPLMCVRLFKIDIRNRGSFYAEYIRNKGKI